MHITFPSKYSFIKLVWMAFFILHAPIQTEQIAAPFGTVIGIALGGVPVYSNAGKNNNKKHYNSIFINGREIWTGISWQCVEFARRWLITKRGVTFPFIANACDIFYLTYVNRILDNAQVPIYAELNGSTKLPAPGSMLIWDCGYENEKTGHVAILVNILSYFKDSINREQTIEKWEGYAPCCCLVCIAEQNFDDQPWEIGRDYARLLPAHMDGDGKFFIHENHFLGWVNID